MNFLLYKQTSGDDSKHLQEAFNSSKERLHEISPFFILFGILDTFCLFLTFYALTKRYTDNSNRIASVIFFACALSPFLVLPPSPGHIPLVLFQLLFCAILWSTKFLNCLKPFTKVKETKKDQ